MLAEISGHFKMASADNGWHFWSAVEEFGCEKTLKWQKLIVDFRSQHSNCMFRVKSILSIYTRVHIHCTCKYKYCHSAFVQYEDKETQFTASFGRVYILYI